MIVISFRTRRDKEDMLDKARQMERFSREFVECLENSEHDDYEYENRMYRDENMRHDDGMSRRETRMRSGRYGY